MLRSSPMVRRVLTRAIDWNGLTGKVGTQAARGEIGRLRGIYDDLGKQCDKAAEPVAPIDWAEYEKKISYPGAVAAFKSAYEGLSLPEFVNTQAGEADKVLTKLQDEAKAAMDHSTARAAELQQTLDTMQSHMTTKDTTIDDVCKQYPQLAEEVKKEIAENNFQVGSS